MLGTLVHFDPALKEYNQKMIDMLRVNFGSGRTFNQLIADLNGQIDVSIGYPMQFLQGALAKAKLAPKKMLSKGETHESAFYKGLCVRYETSISLLNSLYVSLSSRRKELRGKNPEVYDKCCGYLLVLCAVLSFNAAVIAEEFDSDKKRRDHYLKKCHEWMMLFEINYFPVLEEDFSLILRRPLAKALADFNVALLCIQRASPANDNMFLLPTELEALVNEKNERAQRNGMPYQCTIIRYPLSAVFESIDLIAMKQVLNEIDITLESKTPQNRKQIIFYCNQAAGPVEVLNLHYNNAKKELEIMSISFARSDLQYDFLKYISDALSFANVKYKILACQANMLPFPHCMQLYAFEFSKMLAKSSFEKCANQSVRVPQPSFDFGDSSVSRPVNEKVQWFDGVALGDKAMLMAPTNVMMNDLFKKVYGAEVGKQKCSFYRRKYNLVTRPLLIGDHQHYYQYAFFNRDKLQRRDDLTLLEVQTRILDDTYDEEKQAQAAMELANLFKRLSLKKAREIIREKGESLSQALKSAKLTIQLKDPLQQIERDAKTLCRGAQGYCTMAEFEFLLAQFAKFSAKTVSHLDEALQLALVHDRPTRALLMLQAKTDKPKKETVDVYAKLPEDSLVKRNGKLKSYFK